MQKQHRQSPAFRLWTTHLDCVTWYRRLYK